MNGVFRAMSDCALWRWSGYGEADGSPVCPYAAKRIEDSFPRLNFSPLCLMVAEVPGPVLVSHPPPGSLRH